MSSLFTQAPQGPLGPGQMGSGGGGQPPQFPMSLAQQLMAKVGQRQQGGLGQSLMQTPLPSAPQMPEFSPTPLPPPTELYGQQNMPSDSMRQNALQLAQAGPGQGMPGMPGALPDSGLPQMPDSLQGQGMGAMAPQTFNPAGGMPGMGGQAPGMAPQGAQAAGQPNLRKGLIDEFFGSLGV